MKKFLLSMLALLIAASGVMGYRQWTLAQMSLKAKADVGFANNQLKDCPSDRACISSTAHDPKNRVDSLVYQGGKDVEAWQRARAIARRWLNSKVLSDNESYMHLEIKSGLFGTIEDFEIQWIPTESKIHLRSMSRIEGWDLDSHAKRISDFKAKVAL